MTELCDRKDFVLSRICQSLDDVNSNLTQYTFANGIHSKKYTVTTDGYGIATTNFSMSDGVPLLVIDGGANYSVSKMHIYDNIAYCTWVDTYNNVLATNKQITLTLYYLPRGK